MRVFDLKKEKGGEAVDRFSNSRASESVEKKISSECLECADWLRGGGETFARG